MRQSIFSQQFIQKNIRRTFRNLDTDKDRRPNRIDCVPYDPRRQHLSKTMRKRIEEQPIYIGHSDSGMNYRILDEDMPKSLKKEREKVLSGMSRHPDVIGEIERKKPKQVTYVRGDPSSNYGYEYDKYVVVRTTFPKKKGMHKEPEYIRKLGYPAPEAESISSTTIHELEHVRQRDAYHGKRHEKLFKGKYEQRKGEKMAREAETKSIRKRYAYPTEEEFEEDVSAFMEREIE